MVAIKFVDFIAIIALSFKQFSVDVNTCSIDIGEFKCSINQDYDLWRTNLVNEFA
jgi:hypothetical protein